MIRQLDEKILVSGQLRPEDVPALAATGVRMLVNNRPDGEEPNQPRAADIEAAAKQAGIAYRFVPILRGIGPSDVEAMREALETEGKMLAFFRSGTRSALAAALALREQGVEADEVRRRLEQAGIDPNPIAHLL